MAVACATDLATAAINPEVACASECYTSLGNAYTSFVDEVRACVRAARRGAVRRGAELTRSLARRCMRTRTSAGACTPSCRTLSFFFFFFHGVNASY